MTSTSPIRRPTDRHHGGPVDGPAGRNVQVGFGLLFLWAAGVHVGIVSADPQLYRHVADAAWFPGIRDAWREIFMATPRVWGLAVAGGELCIAGLLLRGGRVARWGTAATVAFHVGLMTLGWGFWTWSVPALCVLLGPSFRAGVLRDTLRG